MLISVYDIKWLQSYSAQELYYVLHIACSGRLVRRRRAHVVPCVTSNGDSQSVHFMSTMCCTSPAADV